MADLAPGIPPVMRVKYSYIFMDYLYFCVVDQFECFNEILELDLDLDL